MTEDKKDGMDSTWNQPDKNDTPGDGDDLSSGVSTASGPLDLEKDQASEEAPEIMRMNLEPDQDQKKGGPAKTEPARDKFKPFYKKEARVAGLIKLVLYFLLAVFGLGLLGFGIQVFLDGAPFRLEVATTVVIIFALVGFLWKTMSLEAKTGLGATGVGLVLAEVFTVYGGSLGLPWVPGELVLAVVYCLSLAVLLAATWIYWPRLFWPPIAITVLVVYAALDPALWLIAGGTGSAETLVSGPALMQHWPIYLRPGFLMAQVILPAGAILLLVMQGRNIMKPQYESHWGFVFWALLLILTSTTGLAVLERADYPAYPNFPALVARAYPRAMPPAPVATAPVATATGDQTETATPTAATPDAAPGQTPGQAPDQSAGQAASQPGGPAPDQTPTPAPDQTATAAAPSADQAVTEPQTSTAPGSAPTAPAPTASANGETAEATGTPPSSPEEKMPAVAETAPPTESGTAAETGPPATPPSEDLQALQSEVDDLKRQVSDMQGRLQDQEKLIRSLLDYFGSDSNQDRPPWPAAPETMPQPEPDEPGQPDQPGDAAPSDGSLLTIREYCPV